MLTLSIEVGVRLVKHHQERVAIERAGKADALALTGRQAGAVFAELRVVALRQAQDQRRGPLPPLLPR